MRRAHADASASRQRGIAAVELAVALPLLALLLVGIAEGGRIMSEATLLTRAVQTGARYLATNATVGSTGVIVLTPEVIHTTQNLVVAGRVTGGSAVLPGFNTATVTVTSPTATTVEVDAVYVYRPIFHRGLPVLTGGGGSLGITLTARSRWQVLP